MKNFPRSLTRSRRSHASCCSRPTALIPHCCCTKAPVGRAPSRTRDRVRRRAAQKGLPRHCRKRGPSSVRRCRLSRLRAKRSWLPAGSHAFQPWPAIRRHGPEPPRDLTESVEDVLSACRLDLPSIEDAPRRAVPCAQAQHVLAAETGDRPFESHRTCRSLAIWCAISGITRASFGWPISASICWTFLSEITVNGDCSSSNTTPDGARRRRRDRRSGS